MNDSFLNIENNSYIKIDKDIKNAIINNRPIVALESTLISHGFPYPTNLEIAKSSIEAVKKTGSVPATIGIVNGKIKIGLNDSDIQILAKSKNILKVSKHNLAIAINKKINAATTVATTIYIASKIGIKFFATGGIGGVHLESEKTFDISADLTELTKTRMNVICSGAKAILDINKTYEKLETSGIPRIGYKSEKMPGFWYHQTNRKLDYNFNNLKELVEYLKDIEKISESWGDVGSVLIFNPIPKNKSLKKELVDKWIKDSLKKSKENSIEGKDLTPYLIKEVNLLSNNKTLKANMELIVNNALLAGKLANKFYSN